MDAFTRYERAREIGSGASGTVYEAIDRNDGARVALKVLRHPTPEGLYRFKKEFRAMRGIEHPNLVHLRELGVANGEWFFTMDLVPGADFNAHVCHHAARVGGADRTVEIDPRAPRFDEGRLRRAFHQLAIALTALHQRGKVHRDLKPTNVRVRPDGHLVVLDFGLVLDEHELLASGELIVGTPAYMAPEQMTCGEVGPAADWYAAGVMLYEALTGMLPFTGSMFEVLDVRRRATPPLASASAPGIPVDLDRLCADLLRCDPRARPSGHEVLARTSRAPRLASKRRPASLQGREREIETLAVTVERARAGQLAAAFVVGPARAGKSAILEVAAVAAASAPGAAVLNARCHPGEHVPYLALDGIVDALTRVLCDLPSREQRRLQSAEAEALTRPFPVLRRVPVFRDVDPTENGEVEDTMVEGLVHIFRIVSEHCQLVLCIDDLHHSDLGGMRVLNALIRHPDAPAMAILLAAREMPRPRLPQRVTRVCVQPPVWADEHADDTIEHAFRVAI